MPSSAVLDRTLQLEHARGRDQPPAHERVAEARALVRAGALPPHHRAAVEGEADATVGPVHLEHAGLLLLADQLEDLADAEVAQVPVQGDAHAHSSARSQNASPVART
jgi:hypothetical protein